MSPKIRNLPASAHDRLLNRARQRREDFQFVLQRYAAERFLYRLGESPHRDRFVLKGAMLFALWGGSIYRPTRDLDFTGYGSSETAAVLESIREICGLAVEDDGVMFDASTLAAEPIRGDAEYDGLRIRFQATLGNARIQMQIDVGFGNAIEPPADDVEYPTLLGSPPPHICAYPREAVVAEKLHAMLLLGERTSRFKDFYDLYVLAGQFPFDGRRLARAIAATFERRHTPIEGAQPGALAPRFFTDGSRAQQWRAYLSRNALPGAPADFGIVGELLRAFLGSPWSSLAQNQPFESDWRPGGPWGREGTIPLATTALPATLTRRADLVAGAARAGVSVVSEFKNTAGLHRFRPYPAYKESGVEWLGKIPAHWEVRRLAMAVQKITNGFVGPTRDILVNDGTRYLQSLHIKAGAIAFDRKPYYVTDQWSKAHAKSVLREGDVLVVQTGDIGQVCAVPADFDGCNCHALIILRLKAGAGSGFFLSLLLQSDYGQNKLRWSQTGALHPHLECGHVREIPLPLPPLSEQRVIAVFLDRETARIDALVAKKERLIELLQEKRTALITRAVTKGLPAAAAAQAGLDPNVPMKDSGVEWLGEIPAHWEVSRIKHGATKVGSGKTPSGGAEVYVDEGAMLIRSQNVHFGGLRLDDVAYIDVKTDLEMAGTSVREGDVLLNITGASLGRCCVARLDGAPANVNQHVCIIRPRSRSFDPSFLASALASEPVQGQIFNTEAGISRDALNFEQIGNLVVGRPPVEEQHAIATFLDRETRKIDALEAKVRDAIDRLKELRRALISAAVTGKIDVREEVA